MNLSVNTLRIDEAHAEDLERRVRLYLLSKHAELRSVTVSVEGCTVHLSGDVSCYYLRQLAVAKRVARVIRVNDDIVVCDRRLPSARMSAGTDADV